MKKVRKKLEFQKVRASQANRVYLEITYVAGDADMEMVRYDCIGKEWAYSTLIEWLKEHPTGIPDDIRMRIAEYQSLQNILDCNSGYFIDDDYDSVLETYGEEMAGLYENVPRDHVHTGKCHIGSISLVGYDHEAAKYESFVPQIMPI